MTKIQLRPEYTTATNTQAHATLVRFLPLPEAAMLQFEAIHLALTFGWHDVF